MSSENPQQEAPPQAGAPVTVGPCQRCNKEMSYWHPKAEFLNGENISTIAVLHVPTTCPHCGLRLLTQVLGMNGMRFRWVPVPDNDVMLGEEKGEKEPTIITPGQRPKGIVRKGSGLIIPG